MWADVKLALARVDRSGLTRAQKSAIRELEFEMRQQTRQGVKRSIEVSASTSRPLFRSFSSNFREQGELNHTFDWDGESMAVKLQSNLTSDPGDDATETQFNGSYIAGVLGEWVLGVGAIDRWWGAGWQSNLIMTNNARPVPGLMFRTRRSQSFESPWLSWLGDWQFVSFIGQMESDRVVPEAKLTAMRFTFKPHSQIELGVSRVMQWGGDGRDEDLSVFWKSLTSQGENTSEEAGNQIAGFDARFSFSALDRFPSAVYAQFIGEDEASYMPSKYTAQFGLESVFELPNGGDSVRGFLEFTNTTAGALGAEHTNTAYEHHIFQTGYRYRERVMGATFDNDSKAATLGAAFHQTNGELLALTLTYAQLNEDGVQRGNTVSANENSLYFIELKHQRMCLGGRLNLGVSYLSEATVTVQQDIDQAAVFGTWEYRY